MLNAWVLIFLGLGLELLMAIYAFFEQWLPPPKSRDDDRRPAEPSPVSDRDFVGQSAVIWASWLLGLTAACNARCQKVTVPRRVRASWRMAQAGRSGLGG